MKQNKQYTPPKRIRNTPAWYDYGFSCQRAYDLALERIEVYVSLLSDNVARVHLMTYDALA